MSDVVRVLVFGAHPDDAEYHAGGMLATYRQLGHRVKMVSVTDGSAGHHRRAGAALAAERKCEAAAAAAVIGAECEVWDYPDGRLEPTLAVRERIIAAIRSDRPDLILTHRTNDYHPDHRAVGLAVQDAAFLVSVPTIVPEVPVVERVPVVACMPDLFTRPAPLRPDVVFDADPCLDTIVAMLACHRSQVFEWLPHLEGQEAAVPDDEAGRMVFLRRWFVERAAPRAAHFREALVAALGVEQGRDCTVAELYEISEYGAPLDPATRQRLFPFLP